jgi:hypothetical protein
VVAGRRHAFLGKYGRLEEVTGITVIAVVFCIGVHVDGGHALGLPPYGFWNFISGVVTQFHLLTNVHKRTNVCLTGCTCYAIATANEPPLYGERGLPLEVMHFALPIQFDFCLRQERLRIS